MRPRIPVSYYRCARGPTPYPRVLTWEQLSADLRRFRPHSGSKEERLDICPLWSPVRLRDGATRSTAAVELVTMLVLDYDDGTHLRAAMHTWRQYAAVGYTTWSHTEEAPRCRVALPLVAPIPADIWGRVYRSVLATQARDADRACSDPGRAYFVPAAGAGGLPTSSRGYAGAWLELRPLAAEQRRAKAAEARARDAKARALRARVGELYASHDRLPAENEALLRRDPDAREALGMALGGRVVDSPQGRVVRGVTCPACARPDVWWPVVGGSAS